MDDRTMMVLVRELLHHPGEYTLQPKAFCELLSRLYELLTYETTKLAIATAQRDPTEARWIDDRLASGRDRVDVGKSAAYHCQIVSLGLLPWEIPPCYAMARPAVYDHQRASRRLLGRMLDAGVSKWHPDPVAACEAAEAEAKRQAAK
jgi:hypothetical protein